MTGTEIAEVLKKALEPVTGNLAEINRKMGNDADTEKITRCMNCAHCFDLEPVDPMKPYSGTGDGSFFCMEFDMDFYAPHYRAETFYCKDGTPRATP